MESRQQRNEEGDDNETAKVPFFRGRKMIGKVRSNLAFRSKWAEVNGAMGDLGTYIPIVLALTLSRGLDLGTTLIFTGAYNLLTGAFYGVPMPVQPMKSIAAAALSDPNFGVPEIMAAGILTGSALLLLGATGLMHLVYRLVPLSVVRGIQLAQGLSFSLTAVKYVRKLQNLPKSKSLGNRPWLGLDGLILALSTAAFILLVSGAGPESEPEPEPEPEPETDTPQQARTEPIQPRRWRRILFSLPSALMVTVLGTALAFARRPGLAGEIKAGPSRMGIVKIPAKAWRDGFVKGTVPQLPLSVLNSVVAVVKLSADLFPGRGEFSATSLSVSVGLMNLTGCWVGAMPCCHGAGGLAGQYRFGGRSGACVALLGAAKAVLGLVLGSSLVAVLSGFPVGLLGVLLLFAGIELAMTCRDMDRKEDVFVVLVVTAVSLVGSSAALGFLVGMVVYGILRIRTLGSGSGSERPRFAAWIRGTGIP